MTKWILIIGVFILIVIGAVLLIVIPSPHTAKAPTIEQPASLPDLLTVTTPLPRAAVTSPLTISGQARGTWYFEASAPIELRNSVGAVIAHGHIGAKDDWMTADFVAFDAVLTFPEQPGGSTGTLVLKNDNPSGDPSTEKELDIPVTF